MGWRGHAGVGLGRQHRPLRAAAAGAGAEDPGVLQDISPSSHPGTGTAEQAVKHSMGS